jgi:hypothetical protein
VPVCNTLPDQLLAALQFFIGLFKAPYKTVGALLLLSVVSLLAPNALIDHMQIGGWVRSHRVAEWGFCLFAAFYFLLFAIELCVQRFLLRRRLHRLIGDERRVIHTFIKWQTLTNGFISGVPTATAMAKIGMLEYCKIPPDNNRAKRGESFFTIKRWIFFYLNVRPHLIRAEEFNILPPPKNAQWPEVRRWLEETDGRRGPTSEG